MDRYAHSRPVANFQAGNWLYEVASAQDDAALRRLLRLNPLPGWLELTYEREPSYFLGATIEGDEQQTLITRDKDSGDIVGCCSRAEYDAFINGKVQRIGYLGQLRFDPDYHLRGGRIRRGFAACRQLLHEPGHASLYLTSILADNQPARRLLLANLPGMPGYHPVANFVAMALPVRQFSRLRAAPRDLEIRRATPFDLREIARFLKSHYQGYQFAPVWDDTTLWSPLRCRGLAAGDFFLAKRQGALVGVAALWDQRPFKQHVVRGYHPWIARHRATLNRCLPWLGLQELPTVGSTLRSAYVSHLAILNHDPTVCFALLHALGAAAPQQGIDSLIVGLGDRHPLLKSLQRRYRHLTYRSLLCAVCWADGEAVLRSLDSRPVHTEISTL